MKQEPDYKSELEASIKKLQLMSTDQIMIVFDIAAEVLAGYINIKKVETAFETRLTLIDMLTGVLWDTLDDTRKYNEVNEPVYRRVRYSIVRAVSAVEKMNSEKLESGETEIIN